MEADILEPMEIGNIWFNINEIVLFNNKYKCNNVYTIIATSKVIYKQCYNR